VKHSVSYEALSSNIALLCKQTETTTKLDNKTFTITINYIRMNGNKSHENPIIRSTK